MKKITSFLTALLSIGFLIPAFVPAFVFAQTSNITTGNTSLVVPCVATSSVAVNGVPPCDFNTLIDTGTHIIQWFFYISIPIMVALMAYSGILYMTGVEKNISHAKSMFLKVAGGFTIMLIAFVVINTLVGWITNNNFTTTSSNAPSNPAVLLNNK
jgi:hypothetical protein